MTKNKLSLVLFIIIVLGSPLLVAGELTDAIGFWKSVDSKKGFTTSVIAVYEHNNLLYGRVVVGYDEKTGELIDTMYNPNQQVHKLPEQPLLLTIDIFWNLQPGGTRWLGGRILDPRSGRTYSCECWVQDGDLIIRGKVGPFGMNNVFHKAQQYDFPYGFILPDLQKFRPNIPEK
ncbi:MAG: DUF2147 domain-containing protein [Sphaerochaetaceae bacterium]|nr:DUF2147 domain-containing protein [Sphaerochaetaceae bacterium]MDD4220345.1 DUF2147 domain-containing protein [Sphaerochaetaceae bacterium]